MKPSEPCLLDSSVLIQGQRDPQWFSQKLTGMKDVATCHASVGEYAVGMYAAAEKKTRDEARAFYKEFTSSVARHPHLPDDFDEAARLIGEAIFSNKAKPSFPDGLIAACARRLNRIVWTKDEGHFQAMGCGTFNPSEHPSGELAA